MHNLTLKTFLICFLMTVLFSCDDQDGNINPEEYLFVLSANTENPLVNTVWKWEEKDCHVYYDFGEEEFIRMNACFDKSGKMTHVAWVSGTYDANDVTVSFSTENSCEDSQVGNWFLHDYEIEGTRLTLFTVHHIQDFTRIDKVPEIPNDIQLGYWDYDNGGKWNTIESCQSPYQ